MNTPNERLSEALGKAFALILDEIEDDTDKYAHLQAERIMHTRESMERYKQYLLTLDPDMLLNIMDIWEDGSIFVTHPVELDTIDDIALTYRAYNMLYGPPGTHNTYPLFAIPKGKYRFVLIAVPVEDDV